MYVNCTLIKKIKFQLKKIDRPLRFYLLALLMNEGKWLFYLKGWKWLFLHNQQIHAPKKWAVFGASQPFYVLHILLLTWFSNANCMESNSGSFGEVCLLAVCSRETARQPLILWVSSSGYSNLKIVFQEVSEIQQFFSLQESKEGEKQHLMMM